MRNPVFLIKLSSLIYTWLSSRSYCWYAVFMYKYAGRTNSRNRPPGSGYCQLWLLSNAYKANTSSLSGTNSNWIFLGRHRQIVCFTCFLVGLAPVHPHQAPSMKQNFSNKLRHFETAAGCRGHPQSKLWEAAGAFAQAQVLNIVISTQLCITQAHLQQWFCT